jgi:hypothetical protein
MIKFLPILSIPVNFLMKSLTRGRGLRVCFFAVRLQGGVIFYNRHSESLNACDGQVNGEGCALPVAFGFNVTAVRFDQFFDERQSYP